MHGEQHRIASFYHCYQGTVPDQRQYMRNIQQTFGRERALAIERTLWGRCGDVVGTLLGCCGDVVRTLPTTHEKVFTYCGDTDKPSFFMASTKSYGDDDAIS